ncbi:MAG: hypothetical protein QXS85_03590 [Acidilobaceae archaeon]
MYYRGVVCLETSRIICWLRGDPEFVAVARRARSLLGLQGVAVLMVSDTTRVDCDAIVCCGCSAEEICRDDPWSSLFEALSPRRRFHTLRIGVDPGSLCSLAAYADNFLIWLEKNECTVITTRTKWLTSIVPASHVIVNVGSGPGWERVARELSSLGVSFRIVSETETSSKPLHSRLRYEIKDEDLLAAMTISLSS